MEKAVVQDLLGEVVHHLVADFRQVIARIDDRVGVADGNAVHVLHHQHVGRAVLKIGLGAADEGNITVEQGELTQVLGFAGEVGFLDEGDPQLFHHGVEVEHLVVRDETIEVLDDGAQHVDVLRHNRTNPGALHFNGHLVAVHERGLVNLRQRSAAQGLGVDRPEYPAAAITVHGIERRHHLLEGQRRGVGLQMRKLVAVSLRQDLGARGQNLPDLHEGRAQVFQDRTEFGRAHAILHIVLADDAKDLAHAGKTRLTGKLVALLVYDGFLVE